MEASRSRCASRPATPTSPTGRSASTPSSASPSCWRGYCDDIGRPFDDIIRTHGPDCRIFDTDAEARAWCAEPDGGDLWGDDPVDEYLRDNLVGTVEQVTEKAQAFVDAGCRQFILWLRDFPGDETLRRFIAEVAPHLSI